MLVYGDHCDRVEARLWLGRVGEWLAQVASLSGLERHSKLVGALVETGRIEQALADGGSGEAATLNAFNLELARCVIRSSESGYAETGELPHVPQIESSDAVEMRVPEGFAFYALYPEAYAAAARRLRLTGPPRIIGIRSIGTTLGAVVAAALGAPPPLTVRPSGDPFARQLELAPNSVDRGAHYVIVDEGPGLSGSSFGAVADALEAHGVPLDRICFMPAHGEELGPRASEAHRARWNSAQRVAAKVDTSFLAERFGPLDPFSTGEPWERLKFIAHNAEGKILLKFAGLASVGERKLEMARALHAAGLSPEPLGLVHGFLAERWREDAVRLAAEDKPVEEIGHYIGTRARLFPAPEASGATTADLLAMCRRNLSQALRDEAAAALGRWSAAGVSASAERVRTDNKLDRGEWLRLADGRLLKTDALDHHCGHDLIGCQDMAWDVAAAIVEFALDDDETRLLVRATEQASGRGVHPALLDFHRLAYCCFRIGQAKLAGELCSDAAERERLASRGIRYETAVLPLLKQNYCCFTRQTSTVD